MTNCYDAKLHSDKLAVAAVLRHEEIYRTNFLPTSMHSKLNVTILGRNISVLEVRFSYPFFYVKFDKSVAILLKFEYVTFSEGKSDLLGLRSSKDASCSSVSTT